MWSNHRAKGNGEEAVGRGVLKTKGVQDLLSHTNKARDCAVLGRGNRFVSFPITKENVHQRSMCISLKESSEAMRNHCIAHRITKKLNWEKVLKILEDVFQDTDSW
uniref:Uncharacterized protein n=1 Tax=Eptatretus burgeri TaxID=7764 RepID=A0A8C4R517_EPTBU